MGFTLNGKQNAVVIVSVGRQNRTVAETACSENSLLSVHQGQGVTARFGNGMIIQRDVVLDELLDDGVVILIHLAFLSVISGD